MPTSDQVVSPADGAVLQQYLSGDAASFAELVRRHAGFVYSVAFRQLRDRHLAEDVAQAVFLLVVRKAPSLLGHEDLCGWLFTATMFEARNMLKSRSREARRIEKHGREAANRRDDAMPSSTWDDVEPHLDEALEALNDGERTAVMLRYLRRNSYEQVGAALGVTPAAARQRVHRALEHMREGLARRGVVVASAAGLAAEMRLNGVLSPPADLVANTVEAAGRLAAGGAAGATGALVTASAKTKGIAAALIIGTVGVAAVAVAIIARHRPAAQTMYVEPATGGVTITTAPPAGGPAPARPPTATNVRPPFQLIRAASADAAQGTRTVGGFVGYINKDDYLRFDRVDLGPPGTATFTTMVACPAQYAGNRIEVRVDRLDGPLLATLTVKSTGGHGNWRPQSAPTAPHAGGVHDVFLRFSGGGWNFDTFTLVASARPAVGPINAVTFNEAGGVHTRGGVVCEAVDGAWVRYGGLQFAPGVNGVAVTYACDAAHAGGALTFRLDRPDGPPLATMRVESTGNFHRYVTRIVPFDAIAGSHDVIITFSGKGPGVANLSSLEFRRLQPTPATAPASVLFPVGD